MNSEIDNNNLLKEYLNVYQNAKENQIYNLKYEKFPYILQFNQLIKYYKNSIEFKKILSEQIKPINQSLSKIKNEESKNNDTINKKIIVQNKYCLIDKNWIQKWKAHIGYEEILKILNKNNNSEITYKDYKWIKNIIEENSTRKFLSPLDNINIFKEKDEIEATANFEIISIDCYNLFILGGEKIDNKTFPVRFLKEKCIVFLSKKIFWILFKIENSDKYSELIIDFSQINSGKKNIIDILVQKDINTWLKEEKLNISSETEKELTINNSKLKIINKSLFNTIKEKNFFYNNNVLPNMQNGRYELLNVNNCTQENITLVQSQRNTNLLLISNKIALNKIDPQIKGENENINKFEGNEMNKNDEINEKKNIPDNNNNNIKSLMNKDNNEDDQKNNILQINGNKNDYKILKNIDNNEDFIRQNKKEDINKDNIEIENKKKN